jgi:hypothetical protein
LEFVIQSPLKSSAFVAKSRRERDLWVQRIGDACRAAVVGAGAMGERMWQNKIYLLIFSAQLSRLAFTFMIFTHYFDII